MAVDPAVTRSVVRAELVIVRDLARTFFWGIIPDPSGLKFLATMYAHTGDLFILDVDCLDYREMPPLVEFVDFETGERGTARAYPRSHDSLFHSSGPCICAPFNRKAYKQFYATGPHNDWSVGEWARSDANNYHWSDVSTLGGILGLIQTRLSRPDYYRGRLA